MIGPIACQSNSRQRVSSVVKCVCCSHILLLCVYRTGLSTKRWSCSVYVSMVKSINGAVLLAACFLLSALVLCVCGVRVWVVSEGLVTSHCICSVALVIMATRVEIKQGIVSERSGKCVLMWVWGNGVAQIVSFWLSSPGDATNPKQQRAEKSLSQSTRNFAPVAPSLCTEYGFIAAENPLSIQIHHEGNKLSAFCF